ncbi:MAG: nuclear transport factor 2 family protein [Balneola sp.]|nr:nuclear transport factor 2 family protein [Balneola sp.]MBO6651731.1 nuclear transport factor 2 family protein [Balneola sp.]MBO6711079.1 nuclear transport factor 2 family protein [Balneola sp.]MBO6800807.1 nuclear transport factor 2 family protein [Balneola sp.]MBO6869014.1 nuclear transport factor 2 family protein [Balneola sp.]
MYTKFTVLAAILFFVGINASAQEINPVELPEDLQQVLTNYETHWKNSDAKALASLFTEDGFILRPGHDLVKGRENIQTSYENVGGGDLVLRAYDYSVQGNLAYIIGGYTYGSRVKDMGKYTLTLKKINGNWLIHSDMDNGNSTN